MGDISHLSDFASRSYNGPVEFPGFKFRLNPPETFFGTPVHWYGLIIAVGLVLAVMACIRIGKRRGISEDIVLDMVICGTPAAIIGARLYYVIFRWENYSDNLLGIFKIWEGGLAIYGGVIGAVTAVIIYCKVKKINVFKCLDLGCIGLSIGQAIGRWGNFVNREAFGAPASSLVPWRMRLYTDATLSTWAEVHPTFLYESLWNVGVFFVLNRIIDKKKFDGQVFWTYLLTYGVGRLWIESLRMDSLYLGPVRISQFVALCTAVVAVVMIVTGKKKVQNKQQNIEERT